MRFLFSGVILALLVGAAAHKGFVWTDLRTPSESAAVLAIDLDETAER